MKEEMYDVMIAGYFDKDEVKRFMYIELMTIKTILLAKGVTEAEYKMVRDKVEKKVYEELRQEIDEMRKKNPKEAAVMDTLSGFFDGFLKSSEPKASSSESPLPTPPLEGASAVDSPLP
jgi:homoserine kinase